MNNPIKIFNEIFDAYFKYINSGLPFCREEYNQERNALIQETGTICQPPIIEIVPKYHEKATLKEFCKNEVVHFSCSFYATDSSWFIIQDSLKVRWRLDTYSSLLRMSFWKV